MAEQVERDVAEREVFFELGGARDPPTELLGEDERVVADAQRVLGFVGARDQAGAGQLGVELDIGDGDRGLCFCAHRCGTPWLFS